MSYDEAKENYDVLVKEFEDVNIAEYRELVSILHTWKKEIINSFRQPYDDHKPTHKFSLPLFPYEH